MDKRLQFEIPDPRAPGFLRRQRECMRLYQALKYGGTLADMDAMIAFLLQFVTEPADRDQAHELLLDISRAEYDGILAAIMRENPDFLPFPAANETTSLPGTGAMSATPPAGTTS